MSKTTSTLYTCDQCGAQEAAPGRGSSAPKGWTSMFGGIRAHLCRSCTAVLVPWFSRFVPGDGDGDGD